MLRIREGGQHSAKGRGSESNPSHHYGLNLLSMWCMLYQVSYQGFPNISSTLQLVKKGTHSISLGPT